MKPSTNPSATVSTAPEATRRRSRTFVSLLTTSERAFLEESKSESSSLAMGATCLCMHLRANVIFRKKAETRICSGQLMLERLVTKIASSTKAAITEMAIAAPPIRSSLEIFLKLGSSFSIDFPAHTVRCRFPGGSPKSKSIIRASQRVSSESVKAGMFRALASLR